MKKLTLPKLGPLLLFCALSLGVFFACEKTELEMIEAIELEDAATTQDYEDISIETEDLRSDPKPPYIRIP
ncbi:hypothetical protein [Geofilum rubicundum]|uniref:hypothetical protein n=1 Tax=Geofilum rubicundum TaxID=472113 RepID=UPI000784CDD4|nr:hypothetical protein [Geofilum rubicundum]